MGTPETKITATALGVCRGTEGNLDPVSFDVLVTRVGRTIDCKNINPFLQCDGKEICL